MEKEKEKKSKKIWNKISKVFGLRQTKYGANALVAILALLGILILINSIAKKENFRWDLTKSKKYTLSDQTEGVLKRLDKEVKVTAFYQAGNPEKEEVENLLKEYQDKNDKLKVEFIDPDKNPAKAKQYGIERYGTIIFESDGKKEQALAATESDLTSSILKLSRTEKKRVYFLEGHGEKDIENMDETGYSTLKSSLEKEGFDVSKLSLLTKPEIPQDASVLVLAGPTKQLLDKEKEVIGKYLDEGGKLFALLDPISEVKESAGTSELLKKWGIERDESVVIDPEQYFWTDVSTPVINKWESHQITSKLSAAFFPGVSEVSPASDAPADVTVTSLARTSASSWLERDTEKKQVEFDENSDKKGPISIACAAQKEISQSDKTDSAKKTRLVVVGDSDFAQNAFADALGNQDFFLNSTNYLAEEEELISIRPKEEEERTVALTGKQAQMIFYTTVIGMPAVVVFLGILVWARRRKKR
jgi:ABC-type uncharacterized transport system involved in gliding motility auxiliary subunit